MKNSLKCHKHTYIFIHLFAFTKYRDDVVTANFGNFNETSNYRIIHFEILFFQLKIFFLLQFEWKIFFFMFNCFESDISFFHIQFNCKFIALIIIWKNIYRIFQCLVFIRTLNKPENVFLCFGLTSETKFVIIDYNAIFFLVL